jgi:hypothetical protein
VLRDGAHAANGLVEGRRGDELEARVRLRGARLILQGRRELLEVEEDGLGGGGVGLEEGRLLVDGLRDQRLIKGRLGKRTRICS